jgi:hypothetical protein
VKGDDGVLGEDNLTSIKFLEGEHIVVGVGFDHGGRHRNYLEIA